MPVQTKGFFARVKGVLFPVKKPAIKDNTFFVWEPCSKSHSEVVPGYTKYLLDLGYHVSVLVTPDRLKEGLFSRFQHPNITLNKMSQKAIHRYFKTSDLSEVAGLMVTTVGKLCDDIHFDECYLHFAHEVDKNKLFFVEHEAKYAVDAGTWRDDLIILRKLNYKGAQGIVVNPHYFGEVKITPKNKDITNFITVGAVSLKKKNSEFIINAVAKLHEKGYRNFKVTVVGKGSLKGLPKELHRYFDIKGRLPFDRMYEEIEKADFLLTSYDTRLENHVRYNESGTSGNFQLVYGFCKPCVILRSFGPINEFDETNSILYDKDEDYYMAMEKGINISAEEYAAMQNSLKKVADNLYQTSLENLRSLIDKQKAGING